MQNCVSKVVLLLTVALLILANLSDCSRAVDPANRERDSLDKPIDAGVTHSASFVPSKSDEIVMERNQIHQISAGAMNTVTPPQPSAGAMNTVTASQPSAGAKNTATLQQPRSVKKESEEREESPERTKCCCSPS